jgi:hypothetical protein
MAALVGAVLLSDRAVIGGPVVCMFRRITGHPCPSCGLTRSWQAIGHGRLREAIDFHPFGPLMMLVAAWVATDPDAKRRLQVAGQRWGVYAAAGWTAAWVWRLSRTR